MQEHSHAHSAGYIARFRVTPTAVRHLAVMLTAICCEKHKGEQYLSNWVVYHEQYVEVKQ